MILRAFLIFATIASSSALSLFNEEECLNYTVYPVQYEITIIPYIYKDRSSYYNCEVLITVIANGPDVQMIELDAKDFEIQSIAVLYGNRDIINKYRPYEYNATLGKLYIYLQEPLRQYSVYKTQYNIKITFRKNLSNDGAGIFLVPYEDGGTKYMITTRLSPNKAKYFFPCFDNPRFEAVFKFRVYVIPTRLGVVYFNNTLVIAKEQTRHDLQDNSILLNFMPSPQVALYQIGFHHSQFGYQQITAKNTNDTILLWAQPQKLHYYGFVLNFGESILNLIHEYASVNRPIMYGPINIVAVPSNIDGYEIGSWNLLTNGETRLAHVPLFTSIKQIERMKFELTQQLCRIWLGNPGESERTRWKEEWFKEGVATYLAYYLLAQFEHGIHSMRYRWPIGIYGLQMKHVAMAEDWHHSTPALATFNTSLAVEIPSRYKELVTMKTASILWMIENWLGSDKFHLALVKYINTRRGLFISLENFMTNLDLDTVECQHQFFNGSTASRILNSWFHQSGYPVITVNVLRDRSPNAIQLKQHKFSFNHDNRRDSYYLIPISYLVQNNENCFNCHQPRFTIDQTYTFEENLNGGWIILNRNASGYYRVNYDTVTWKLIAKTLKENRLSIDEQNRAQIVNDAFALYASGDIDHALAVEILDYLDNEFSPLVWDSAIAGFELLKTEKAACNMTKMLYKEWQEFMSGKVDPIYSYLTSEIEQHRTTRLFRSSIVDFACAIQHKQCLDDLRIMYNEYNDGKRRLDPDSREACYYYLYQHDGSFGGHGFNTFEIEDKITAEHKIAKENRFQYRIPVGKRVMDKYVMSTTTAPIDTTTESKTASPEKLGGRASLASTANILVIAVAFFVMHLSHKLFYKTV